MYSGGCLCGKVRFEIDGPINDIVFCHCTDCRKVQGSAYATNGWVHDSKFRLLHGRELLSRYAHVPGKVKYFCRECGSPVMSINDSNPDQIRVRLGTIDTEVREKPKCHIFTASKANWDVICDDLPQFPDWPR